MFDIRVVAEHCYRRGSVTHRHIGREPPVFQCWRRPPAATPLHEPASVRGQRLSVTAPDPGIFVPQLGFASPAAPIFPAMNLRPRQTPRRDQGPFAFASSSRSPSIRQRYPGGPVHTGCREAASTRLPASPQQVARPRASGSKDHHVRNRSCSQLQHARSSVLV